MKYYILRGGMGGGYGNGKAYLDIVECGNYDDAMCCAYDIAYEDYTMSDEEDRFREAYVDENGCEPYDWEISQDAESWLEYSAEELDIGNLTDLYEDGEISDDKYENYKLKLNKKEMI